MDNVTITSYVVQIQSNATTIFGDSLVGTTIPVKEEHTWEDIKDNLEKFSASTNIHPRSENEIVKTTPNTDDSSDEQDDAYDAIAEIRINGSVSGILIPNTKKIVVRILVPVNDENGNEIFQDMRYVEWKTVCFFKHLKFSYILNLINLIK